MDHEGPTLDLSAEEGHHVEAEVAVDWSSLLAVAVVQPALPLAEEVEGASLLGSDLAVAPHSPVVVDQKGNAEGSFVVEAALPVLFLGQEFVWLLHPEENEASLLQTPAKASAVEASPEDEHQWGYPVE